MSEHLERWMSLPLNEVLEECGTYLKYGQSKDTEVTLIDGLLVVVSLHFDVDISLLNSISSLIKNYSTTNPNICSLLLSHITSLPNPIPFINQIPAIFSMKSAQLVSDLVNKLSELIDSDNRYMLPIVSNLVDMYLPTDSRLILSQLCENALGVVDESDIPFLCRTILRNSELSHYNRILKRMRQEVGY
jgi:hypothetical protein